MKEADRRGFEWLLLFLILSLHSCEVGKLHKHLHYIECETIGYMTDTDGTRWDGSNCPRRD